MADRYTKKSCPRCGEALYADMDVCYGCLYDFGRKDNGPSELAGALEEPEGLVPQDPRLVSPPVPPSQPPSPVPPSPAPAPEPAPAPVSARGPSRPVAPGAFLPEPAGGERPASAEDGELTQVLEDRGGAIPCCRVWVRSAGADVLVPVCEEGLDVGRGSGNQVVIHDRSVSRRHLRLVPAPDGIEAADLGATNPARFRGTAITGPVLVPFGESVQVGEVTLLVCP